MPYCHLCKEWLGFMGGNCENKQCDLTDKLIDLYGIEKVGDALSKVFIRNGKSVDFRSTNIDKLDKDKKESK